ncbi:unnamed protein product [Echinostoma caproni]|uniref:MSC domain-containing protein n=1 Tax=Echinostoma caproni TaxID=27848 RepID=A0A183B075_9TREM|nr:unnamed protein product [Echinostoma caproni]
MADLQRVICPSSVPDKFADPIVSHNCLPQTDVAEALPVLSTTFDVLSRYAGEYHCKQNRLSSPRMSVISAEGLVQLNTDLTKLPNKEFKTVWRHVLFLILHVGKAHFNIASYDASGKELGPGSAPHHVSELESLQPYFSGTCRLRHFFNWLVWFCATIFGVLIALSLFIGLVLLLRWIRTKRLQAAEKHSARIRDLVASVVHMLQQQLRENESNSEQPPYIPVYVLRERLRQQHTDAAQLWPDVVRYVYDVETCIGVQEWRGIGETWQWQGGTGWQGSGGIRSLETLGRKHTETDFGSWRSGIVRQLMSLVCIVIFILVPLWYSCPPPVLTISIRVRA